MTARVGRDLTRPLHQAISPSRRNFPAFWRRVHSWDIRVVSTICNLSVGEERWAPIREMRVPATAKFVPMCLPSPGKDGYCVTITCNSVINQTTDCRGERPIQFDLLRIRCLQVVGQHNQPLIQELISQEFDEVLTADRAEYRFRPSASDGSTSRSAKTYLRRSCTFSSMSSAIRNSSGLRCRDGG